jgi:hypothetical protein
MASRRWLPIVLGIALVLCVGVVGLVGSCAYLVHNQVQVRERSSAGDYEREAAAVLGRFDGVPPLVEDGVSGPALSQKALAQRQQRPDAGAITNLHVLVFSPREGKLVRLTLPFWLLRMTPDGRMDIGVDKLDLEKIRLSIDDVESAGPGPLFIRENDDSRVLVWTD